MISARHGGLFLLCTATAIASAVAAAGCNQLFGIREGQLGGAAGDGGTGGAGAAGGSGGSGGTGAGVVCPPEKPAACDAMYLTDSENCCLPGRSCQGGACVDGECLSTPHGQTAGGAEAIAVVRSGDYVLWSGGLEKAIFRSDVDGNGFQTLVGDSQQDFNYVTVIAADPFPSGYVFFTDYQGSRIGRASIETGQTEVLAQVPAAIVPNAEARFGRILVHGDHVYWAMDFQAYVSGEQVGKHIWRAPREPAEALPVDAELVVMTTGAFGVAADDDYLYFGKSDTGTIERLAFSEIGKTDGSGNPVLGAPEVLATGQGDIGEVAVDGERVYWAAGNEVRHMLKGLPNSSISSYLGMDSYVTSMVSDGRDIYITTIGDGQQVQGALWRAPAGTTTAPKKLYETEGDGVAAFKSGYIVTEDCDTVYFVVQQGGLIRKLTK